MNEVALGIDGSSLFDDQHSQQAVGNQKQNGQHGKQRAAGLDRRVRARQVPQNCTPIFVPLSQQAGLPMQLANQQDRFR